MTWAEDFPRGCFISGIGQSETARHLTRPPLELTLDAALAAIADAGLEPADVDGLASYPGASPYLFDVKEGLGLELEWYDAGPEGPAQMGPILNACMAVATGQARNVLVFRTVQMLGGALGETHNEGMSGALDWHRPYGAFTAATWFALHGARFLHERQMTRGDLAWIALTARANAEHNPLAVYRTPLTMDDYLAARMVSTPLCLYDCDAPCNGSIALLVTGAPPAEGLTHPAVRFEAFSGPARGRTALDALDRMAAWDAGPQLWSRTRLRPADVGVAQLYDGFSTITLEWLEALGFCERGGVRNLIDGGIAINRAGRLPLNTGGGMLSAGRIHGFLPVLEACIQLRGDGAGRQVHPVPEVAAVGLGGGPVAGAMLLSRVG